MDFEKLMKEIPLRISVTDYCNLNCFFCSNEGMDDKCRNTSHVNIDNLVYLLKLLKKKGLQKVSLTGGDPTCYANLDRLIEEVNNLNFERTFFHTNGVALDCALLERLKRFDKIAISLHSLDFDKWSKMTNGSREQFDQLVENINSIGKDEGERIEIKIVLIKGVNDSEESIRKVLDFCVENNFKFKFLIFEPINEEDKNKVVSLREVSQILENIGAVEKRSDSDFRGQTGYMPIRKYEYKSIKGVLIEIGCGKKEVCKFCHQSNEIFITPNLEIKPCHVSPKVISLREHIEKGDDKKVLELLLESRCFLKTNPGQNKEYWRQE